MYSEKKKSNKRWKVEMEEKSSKSLGSKKKKNWKLEKLKPNHKRIWKVNENKTETFLSKNGQHELWDTCLKQCEKHLQYKWKDYLGRYVSFCA